MFLATSVKCLSQLLFTTKCYIMPYVSYNHSRKKSLLKTKKKKYTKSYNSKKNSFVRLTGLRKK